VNTDDLRSVLAQRASTVGDDVRMPLDRLHRRIGAARRRRAVTAAAASAGLIAVVAVAAALAAPGSGTGSGEPIDRNTPRPAPSFTVVDPQADGSVALPAGRYALAADGGSSSPLAVLDVPEGFHGFGGWSLGADGGATDQDFFGVSYHAVDAVPEDGCTRDGEPTDAGTSPDDLVAALAAQKMTSITAPEPVALAGHRGVYLELTASERIRPQRCTDRVFEVWSSGADGHWLLFEPGQVDRLWLLDVDGQTVVLDARSVPGVTQDEVNVITGIVESVGFADPS
jgi:hypothetical protein